MESTSSHGQQPHAEYDANLLASAPAATRAQLQGGYTTDLLEEKPLPPPSRRTHDLEAASQRQIAPETLSPPPKVPFYRTKKGIIFIIIGVLVVLAAVIGGVVGASRRRESERQPASQAGGAAVSSQIAATDLSSNSSFPVFTQPAANLTSGIPGASTGTLAPSPDLTGAFSRSSFFVPGFTTRPAFTNTSVPSPTPPPTIPIDPPNDQTVGA